MERKLGLTIESSINWRPQHKNMDRKTFRFYPNAKEKKIIRTLKDERLIDALWGNFGHEPNLKPRLLGIKHLSRKK